MYSMRNSSILSSYIKDMSNFPLLTHEEEVSLAQKAKSGDKAARAKIINSNLRFVVKVAKQYRGMGLELEDLISYGNVGLVMAVDRFDPGKGNHFISYAVWWIKAMIKKALSDRVREIDGQVSLPDDEVLDGFDTPQQSSRRGGFDIDSQMKEAVTGVVRALPPKEAHVIKLRYGLGSRDSGLSLSEVGNKMHLSKEGVRQIEKRAFERLRNQSDLEAWVA